MSPPTLGTALSSVEREPFQVFIGSSSQVTGSARILSAVFCVAAQDAAARLTVSGQSALKHQRDAMTMIVRIERGKSIRAGCIEGVAAELRSIKPDNWELSGGPTDVDLLLRYPYTEDSDEVVSRLFGFVSYRRFRLMEGSRTACCRLITLMEEGIGVVVTAQAEGHPKPAKPFLVSLLVEGSSWVRHGSGLA